MIHYHRYFSTARTEALTDYQQTLAAIEANATATRAREQALAEKQNNLDSERDELRSKRGGRERLLTSLNSQIQDKADQKSRLTEDRKRLESLMAELQRRAQRVEATTFAKGKGKLPWPTSGKLAHRFGDGRSGGLLKWQGIFIDASEGTPVTAVHPGRVAFADWLRGFGMLTIIDHGSGYMSLYAHSDVLYKHVGDRVEAAKRSPPPGAAAAKPKADCTSRSAATAPQPIRSYGCRVA